VTPAQRTLAFEEMFLLQLALVLRRRRLRDEPRLHAYRVTDGRRTRLAAHLPYALTNAQLRVLREIGEDLASPAPMNRLLQGDVGSGKTIVALLTLMLAVESGYQGALMAPTEILAEQHLRNAQRLLGGIGFDCPVTLLSGSLREAARRRGRRAWSSARTRCSRPASRSGTWRRSSSTSSTVSASCSAPRSPRRASVRTCW
jgi:ATP-dependent DNA helicase RecG